jgi:hypothetical protein
MRDTVSSPPVRFRLMFWLVVLLGTLPSAVSGFVLARSHAVDTLCASLRPMVGVADRLAQLRWERVHAWGRFGAMVAGVLVLGYAATWAYAEGTSKLRRRLTLAVLIGVLLPSLAVAIWTGRGVPWRALAPGVSLGESTVLPGRVEEEAGGPAYCEAHPREVNNLRLARTAHFAAGWLALGLIVVMAWRRGAPGKPAR